MPEAVTVDVSQIASRLNNVGPYHPFNADTFADWSMEAGDMITVSREGRDYYSPVHSTTLKWRGSQQITVNSTGNKEREPISRVSLKKYNRGGSALRNQQGMNYDLYSEDGQLHSVLDYTESHMYLLFEDRQNGLFSEFERTASGVWESFADEKRQLFSNFETTASQRVAEFADEKNGLFSTFRDTASQRFASFEDEKNGLFSVFDDTASHRLAVFEDEKNGLFSTFDDTASHRFASFEDEKNGLFSTFDDTASHRFASFEDEKNGLFSVFEDTASRSYEAFVDEKGNLFSEFERTASHSISHFEDTANGFVSNIEQTASYLRIEYAHTQSLLAEIEITASHWQAAYEDSERGWQSVMEQTASQWKTALSAVMSDGKVTAASIATALNDQGEAGVQISGDWVDINAGNIKINNAGTRLNDVLVVNETAKLVTMKTGGLASGEWITFNEGRITAKEFYYNDTSDNSTKSMIKSASVDNNTLTITRFDGTSINFSKATSLSGKWSSNQFPLTIEAKQTNKNASDQDVDTIVDSFTIGFTGSVGSKSIVLETVLGGTITKDSLVAQAIVAPIAINRINGENQDPTQVYSKDITISVSSLLQSRSAEASGSATEVTLTPDEDHIGISRATVTIVREAPYGAALSAYAVADSGTISASGQSTGFTITGSTYRPQGSMSNVRCINLTLGSTVIGRIDGYLGSDIESSKSASASASATEITVTPSSGKLAMKEVVVSIARQAPYGTTLSSNVTSSSGKVYASGQESNFSIAGSTYRPQGSTNDVRCINLTLASNVIGRIEGYIASDIEASKSASASASATEITVTPSSGKLAMKEAVVSIARQAPYGAAIEAVEKTSGTISASGQESTFTLTSTTYRRQNTTSDIKCIELKIGSTVIGRINNPYSYTSTEYSDYGDNRYNAGWGDAYGKVSLPTSTGSNSYITISYPKSSPNNTADSRQYSMSNNGNNAVKLTTVVNSSETTVATFTHGKYEAGWGAAKARASTPTTAIGSTSISDSITVSLPKAYGDPNYSSQSNSYTYTLGTSTYRPPNTSANVKCIVLTVDSKVVARIDNPYVYTASEYTSYGTERFNDGVASVGHNAVVSLSQIGYEPNYTPISGLNVGSAGQRDTKSFWCVATATCQDGNTTRGTNNFKFTVNASQVYNNGYDKATSLMYFDNPGSSNTYMQIRYPESSNRESSTGTTGYFHLVQGGNTVYLVYSSSTSTPAASTLESTKRAQLSVVISHSPYITNNGTGIWTSQTARGDHLTRMESQIAEARAYGDNVIFEVKCGGSTRTYYFTP